MWLMDRLHEHHQAEDDRLWPLIRQRNPAGARLLEAMQTKHRAIMPERYKQRHAAGCGISPTQAQPRRGHAE